MSTKTKKTTTKTVPVKDLRKAIQNGMTYEEAAKHALASLHLGGRGQEGPFPEMGATKTRPRGIQDFIAEFLQFLVEENDHSIRFNAEDARDGRSSWTLECNHPKCPMFEDFYDVGNCMYPDFTAEGDQDELNRLILDFYGIKKHATTKSMVRARAKQIRAEIATKQKEIKTLQAELKKMGPAR